MSILARERGAELTLLPDDVLGEIIDRTHKDDFHAAMLTSKTLKRTVNADGREVKFPSNPHVVGSLARLVDALGHGWPWPTDDRTQYYAACDLVASMGCIAVMERARADGCDWGPSTCSAAARGGHLELLKWARSQGCLWDQQTCAAAARGGHLELLKWARSQGCPWDDRTCKAAATGGHLELLMWARSQGCTWDTHPGMLATCASAAQGGHLELLTWARSQGCPWDTWTRHAHTAHSVRRRSTSHHATQPA